MRVSAIIVAQERKSVQELSRKISLSEECIVLERLREHAEELERRRKHLEKWYLPSTLTYITVATTFLCVSVIYESLWIGAAVAVFGYAACGAIQWDIRRVVMEAESERYAIYSALKEKLYKD